MKQSRRQFVRTLFAATQAAALGSFLPPVLLAAEPARKGLNFLALGDWGRGGEKKQTAVATHMGHAASQDQAQFVISVGDNFYENGVASANDPHWQKSFEQVYTALSLQVPWHAILGNHDYHGNCDAQIDYHQTSPRWNMPARYYLRTERIDAANSVDFFFLDTTPMVATKDDLAIPATNLQSQDVAKQIAWLETALAASTAPWKIVVGHHPIYSGGFHGDTHFLIQHVLPLLEKYQVQAFINGHDHDLQHLQAGKVNLFCTGGGSTPRDLVWPTKRTKFGRGTSGFIAATLSPDQLAVRMIDETGKTLYTANVPRQA